MILQKMSEQTRMLQKCRGKKLKIFTESKYMASFPKELTVAIQDLCFTKQQSQTCNFQICKCEWHVSAF